MPLSSYSFTELYLSDWDLQLQDLRFARHVATKDHFDILCEDFELHLVFVGLLVKVGVQNKNVKSHGVRVVGVFELAVLLQASPTWFWEMYSSENWPMILSCT